MKKSKSLTVSPTQINKMRDEIQSKATPLNQIFISRAYNRYLVRVAKYITGRDVRVHFDMSIDTAYTDNKRIVLNPMINLPDVGFEGRAKAILALVAHEIFHVLLTDFVVLRQIVSYPGRKKLLQIVNNILEDSYIEYVGCQIYVGDFRSAILYLRGLIMEMYDPLDEVKGNTNKLVTAMSHYGSCGMLKGELSAEIQPTWDKIEALMEIGRKEVGAQERFNCAIEITKLMEPIADKELADQNSMNSPDPFFGNNADSAKGSNQKDKLTREEVEQQLSQLDIHELIEQAKKMLEEGNDNGEEGEEGQDDSGLKISVKGPKKDQEETDDSDEGQMPDVLIDLSGDDSEPSDEDGNNEDEGPIVIKPDQKPGENEDEKDSDSKGELGDSSENSKGSDLKGEFENSSEDNKDSDLKGEFENSSEDNKDSESKDSSEHGKNSSENGKESETKNSSKNTGSEFEENKEAGEEANDSDVDKSNDEKNADEIEIGGNPISAGESSESLDKPKMKSDNQESKYDVNADCGAEKGDGNPGFSEKERKLKDFKEQTAKEKEIYEKLLKDLQKEFYEDLLDDRVEEAKTKVFKDISNASTFGINHSSIKNNIYNATTDSPNAKFEYEEIVANYKPIIEITAKKLKKVIKSSVEETFRKERMGKFNVRDIEELFRDGQVFERTKDGIGMEVAFTILVDESGSMSHKNNYINARRAAVVFKEICDKLNIPVMVMGFTTDGTATRHYIHCNFDTPNSKKYGIATISAHDSNRDGYSIRFAGEVMNKFYPERKKVLIVISDGQPAHYNYSGYAAINDIKKQNQYLEKKHHTSVIAVNISGNYDLHEQMFKKVVHVRNFAELPDKMVGILKKEFKRLL